MRSYSEMTLAERAFVHEESAAVGAMYADDAQIKSLLEIQDNKAALVARIGLLEGFAALCRKHVPALLDRVARLERREGAASSINSTSGATRLKTIKTK